MFDPESMDQWFKELRSAPKIVPAATALSTARFLLAFDPNKLGARLYLDTIPPRFLSALEALDTPILDPEMNGEIRSCIARLSELGEIRDEAAQQLQTKLDRPPSKRGKYAGARLLDDRCPLPFPVVQELIDHPRKAPSFLGLVCRLRIYPRTVRGPEPSVRLLPGGRSVAMGSLTDLNSVAETAFAAAVATAPPKQRRLLGRGRSERHVFDIALPEFEVPVAGSSAGLALAVGMLGALTGQHRRSGRGFRMRPETAWTGLVDETGRVSAVANGSLEAKVRAAYFEGLRKIVVPRVQIAMAEESVPGTERPLRVLGIDHLREVLQMEDVIETWNLPGRVRHTPKPPLSFWEAFVRTVLVPTLIILGIIALVNFLWGGKSYDLDELHAQRIFILQRGFRPATFLDLDVLITHHGVYGNLAGDPTGEDRLVVATQFGPHSGGNGDPILSQLRVYELPWLPFRRPRLMWAYTFETSGLPYDPVKDSPDIQYNPVKLWVGNIDEHPATEIVLATTAHPYSPTFFHLFAGLTYPSGAIAHPGHPAMADLQLIELGPERGKALVAFCKANRVAGGAVLVLQRDDFIRVDFDRVRKSSDGGWEPQEYICNQDSSNTETRQGVPAVRTVSDRVPGMGDSEQGYSEFDLARQSCFAYITIPGDSTWNELRSSDTLELIESRVLPRNGDAPIVGIGIACRFDREPKTDYFARFALPDTLIRFDVNAHMANYAQTLLRSGRTTVDLSSREFLDNWTSRFRFNNYIYWDTTQTGTPLVVKP